MKLRRLDVLKNSVRVGSFAQKGAWTKEKRGGYFHEGRQAIANIVNHPD